MTVVYVLTLDAFSLRFFYFFQKNKHLVAKLFSEMFKTKPTTCAFLSPLHCWYSAAANRTGQQGDPS
jgi:hypothetical protein